MCAPCKILLNGHAATGLLSGIESSLGSLNRRGFDIPDAAYHEGVQLICDFHDALLKFEKHITDGPYVPFQQAIIPNAKKP